MYLLTEVKQDILPFYGNISIKVATGRIEDVYGNNNAMSHTLMSGQRCLIEIRGTAVTDGRYIRDFFFVGVTFLEA